MQNYTFERLNDKEFENIARDLLQLEWDISLETFKSGKDQGIDLRYAIHDSPNNIVVQAKHWNKTGYSKLYSHLAKDELAKVKKLNPKRYVLVTSVPFTPQNKKDIKKLFGDYILCTEDIIGLDDLNNLLGKYEKIEKKYYKLWISSTAVLQNILFNGVTGRSEFQKAEICDDISLFVKGQTFDEAINILDKYKFLLIKGEPGIGKTTLAKFIIYTYLADNFELVYIEDDIKEAENVFFHEKKQIFYFDDFLGANYLELIKGQNNDSRLVSFINRVKKDKNKRLILTSRTTILTQAKLISEKLQFNKVNLAEHELNIETYDDYDKANILYNHVFFSKAPKEYLDEIFENGNYWKIIKHKNYNPRIIQFITDPYYIGETEPQKYIEFIMKNLNKPDYIWRNAYENQTDDYSKFLLTSLFSISGSVSENILKSVFEARLDYEIKKNGFKRVNNPFYSRIKELLGGFINRSVHQRFGNHANYSFFNPAINDFFIGYLNDESDEKWRILESAIYVEQFTGRFNLKKESCILINKEERSRFLELIREKAADLKTISTINCRKVALMSLYATHFDLDEIDEDILTLFNEDTIVNLPFSQFKSFVSLVGKMKKNLRLRTAVLKYWDKIILRLFDCLTDYNDIKEIEKLFQIYEIDPSDYMKSSCNREYLQMCIDNFWNDFLEDFIETSDELSEAFEDDELDRAISNLRYKVNSVNDMFSLDKSPAFSLFDEIDAADTIDRNRERLGEEDYINHYYESNTESKEKDVVSKINALFSQ